MFDAFPYDEWSDKITTFWTFGVEGDTGTIILTVLGVIADDPLARAVRPSRGTEARRSGQCAPPRDGAG